MKIGTSLSQSLAAFLLLVSCQDAQRELPLGAFSKAYEVEVSGRRHLVLIFGAADENHMVDLQQVKVLVASQDGNALGGIRIAGGTAHVGDKRYAITPGEVVIIYAEHGKSKSIHARPLAIASIPENQMDQGWVKTLIEKAYHEGEEF